MRKLILVIALVTSPALMAATLDHAPFDGPTPYAADQLDADKNACMLHGLPKPPPTWRFYFLSNVKPQSWEPGFADCDAVFERWRAKVNAARAARGESPI